MAGLDEDTIRHALSTARSHGIAYVEISHGDDRFSAFLEPSLEFHDEWEEPDTDSTPVEGELAAAASFEVTSPCVGYFRMGPGELAIGSLVTEGAVVGAVAALGIDHDLTAQASGTVDEVYVQPQQAVEYGQPIMRVKVT